MIIMEHLRGFLPDRPPKDARQCGPLVLAYMGDTVYDLYVRTALILNSDATSGGLHRQATKLVCASAQAAASRRIAEHLTQEETGVFHRGRNSHLGGVPKNALMSDYRAATGLEALIGYLYLTGQDERLGELMRLALSPAFEPNDHIEQKDEE